MKKQNHEEKELFKNLTWLKLGLMSIYIEPEELKKILKTKQERKTKH